MGLYSHFCHLKGQSDSKTVYFNLPELDDSVCERDSFLRDPTTQNVLRFINSLGLSKILNYSEQEAKELVTPMVEVLKSNKHPIAFFARHSGIHFDLACAVANYESIFVEQCGGDRSLWHRIQPLLRFGEYQESTIKLRVANLAQKAAHIGKMIQEIDWSISLSEGTNRPNEQNMSISKDQCCVGDCMVAIENSLIREELQPAQIKGDSEGARLPIAFSETSIRHVTDQDSQVVEYQAVYQRSRAKNLSIESDFICSNYLSGRGIRITSVYPQIEQVGDVATPVPFLPLLLKQIYDSLKGRKEQLLLAIQPNPAHALRIQLYEPYQFRDPVRGDFVMSSVQELFETISFYLFFAYPKITHSMCVGFTTN